jgi:cyclin-dependent kinase 8/11
MDKDFVDFFTEDLDQKNTSLSPNISPQITSPMRRRIDSLSNEGYNIQRPAYRGPAPSEDEIEPPIMPLEHCLEGDLQCLVYQERLPNDTITTARLQELPSIQSLSVNRNPDQAQGMMCLSAFDCNLSPSDQARHVKSHDHSDASHHLDPRPAEPVDSVQELNTNPVESLPPRLPPLASLFPAHILPNSYHSPHIYTDGLIRLDPLDRKMPPAAYTSKVKVRENYQIVGFISSGTYGRVYKAVGKAKPGDPTSPTTTNASREVFAIKKFKPDKEGETIQYTGLSQSAIREISLCSELSHPNLIHLVEIILEDKCIYMVFEYCEHDLLQIIHHHTQPSRHAIPAPMIKSILFQLLNGLLYLHRNWVLHRDLKPANIMVTSNGAVRIGDLGLARLFYKPLTSLFSGDKVVVTIWYRSPDLLLGSKHYTPAVDLWAVGCIFAELLSLRPIFKGEEAKMDSKKQVPFQRNQMIKIIEVLGIPTKEDWPGIVEMPEYAQLQSLAFSRTGVSTYSSSSTNGRGNASAGNNAGTGTGLETWYNNVLRASNYPTTTSSQPSESNSNSASPGPAGYDLLSALLTYDPTRRLTAEQALQHPYFTDPQSGKVNVSANCFEGLEEKYPHRRVSSDDNGIGTGSLPGTKRSALPDDGVGGKRRG